MIEVRLSHSEVQAIPGVLNKDEALRNRFKEAGVNLRGLMLIGGLQGGTLVVSTDDMFGEWIYRYYPAGETPK